MAVQAQFYSDHNDQSNNIMGFSNLPQDWGLMSGSSVFRFGDENRTLCFSYDRQEDQGLLDPQNVVNFDCDYRNLVSSSNSRRNGVIGLQNLCSELEKQRLEMNSYVHLQNEKLKAVLNEETRKKEAILMQTYESKMKAILEAKDEALHTAKIKSKKLQNYLTMADKEAKIWERKAMETEVTMTKLHSELKQERARRHEDAESVFNGDEERQRKMVCKMCHVRSTCILLLPCRHLCCCRACEGLLMYCPVCETVKNGSLEVFFGLN